MRSPASLAKSSAVRCVSDPLPEDAKGTSPGFARAAATSAASVGSGRARGLTSMTLACAPNTPSAVKSLSGS